MYRYTGFLKSRIRTSWNANGIPDRVLPDDEILHFDMDSGKLESGKKYVEKKLGINDEYDFESVFDRKNFSI